VSPLAFTLEATSGAARAGRLVLPHATVPTPVFMTVGTRATVKACTTDQVVGTGGRILLGNTFHLNLRPGADRVAAAGGLHRFCQWPHAMLTDSGGYQVFSLTELREVTDHGVRFKSPYDGTKMELTPESSIQIQNQLGADIIMAFDECAPFPAERAEVEGAVERTTRWAERCIEAHQRADEQALFGIVQGGVHPDLRARSAEALIPMDFPGYAVGGLSVGEGPKRMNAALDATCPLLPADKPRYLMGVGKPEDLVNGVLRGIDMFDCALPTRNARNGEVFLWPRAYLRLKHARFKDDHRVIDPLCDCLACGMGLQRSYLAHLLRCDEIAGLTYCTLHNLRFYQRLMNRLRRAILDGTLDAFTAEFFAEDGGPEGAADR
jgi:queuine tRNA-ribosyltransferase